MKVICPKCKTENYLPDSHNRNATYKCHACKAELNCGSTTNFRKVAIWILIVWWLVPGLIWTARPIILSAVESSFQEWIGLLFWIAALYALPFLLLATAFFLWKGLRHWKFTGTSPKGFRIFVCMSAIGFCGCATGLALYANSL